MSKEAKAAEKRYLDRKENGENKFSKKNTLTPEGVALVNRLLERKKKRSPATAEDLVMEEEEVREFTKWLKSNPPKSPPPNSAEKKIIDGYLKKVEKIKSKE